jgi:SAM-dependent methyltransferase
MRGAQSEAVRRFEESVLGQRPWAPDRYDGDYFVSDWRDEGNRYDIETRRRIEDRNPALIKDVFAPERVLDVGCGPGALMYLLDELGVCADGIDFAPASKQIAPAEVRERIIIGSVDERHVDDRSYDLVICREVFEHLTVLQIRRTLQAICRASSRYVYVTTRFHPAPNGLLDITTQFEVDPTHITLLNKDFVRTLLVLEGFQCRPDLEERMDWGGKGRVLVYQRADG